MNDAATTPEDTPVTMAVLANDSDPDGDALTVTAVTPGAHGTVSTNGTTITYTPTLNVTGSDSFTYTVSDGYSGSDTATVTMTVTSVNDAPLASADTYSVEANNLLTVAAPGVLANDTDVEGDPLAAVVIQGPVNGSLMLNADGSFTYMPNTDFYGTDHFTYMSTDGALDSGVVTATITITPIQSIPLEIGEVSVDHTWSHVTFQTPFVAPVVVAKPASQHDSDPVVIRIRHVDPTGFDIRLQEWDYQDGIHALETVSYLVMEQGHYTLPDGTQVEASHWTTNQTSVFEAVSFSQPFQVVPVLLTAVASFNSADAVTTRVLNLRPAGFAIRMQEQELNAQSHTTETIAYIAWEPSAGTLNGLTFEVNTTSNVITDQGSTILFQEPFPSPPVFLADMQTTNGIDTANLRWANKDISGVNLHVDEEQSRDTETSHTAEVVGYMIIQ